MKKDKNEDTLKPNELALIRGMLNYKLNDITKRKDGLFSPSELRKAVPLIDAANFPKYLKGNKNEKIRGLMKRDLSYMRTFLHIDKNRITRRISHHGLRKDKEAFKKIILAFNSRQELQYFLSSDYLSDNKIIFAKLVMESINCLFPLTKALLFNYIQDLVIFSGLLIDYLENPQVVRQTGIEINRFLDTMYKTSTSKARFILQSYFFTAYTRAKIEGWPDSIIKQIENALIKLEDEQRIERNVLQDASKITQSCTPDLKAKKPNERNLTPEQRKNLKWLKENAQKIKNHRRLRNKR